MPILRNVEWLDHNSERSYPLTMDSTKKDTTETFTIPDDFILAINLSVGAGINVDPAKFFVKTIGSHAGGFGIVIGYSTGSGDISVASTAVARASHTEYAVYRLGGMGDFLDSVGTITIGKLSGIDSQPYGQFEFELAGSRLEPDAIRPMIRGISALRVQNGSDLSDKIYGDVTLQAGRNMRITLVTSVGDDPLIVFDAIDGAGLTEECVCPGANAPEPIRFINMVPPDASGNFELVGDDCIELEPLTHGLKLTDSCSEPCCGCPELEVVTRSLEDFGRQATTLENFLTNLEARVTQMDQVVLGSRLNDVGCVTCVDDA